MTLDELPDEADRQWVQECLGRRPRSAYRVAARRADGRVSVILNPPLLDDGTPMPTRYWLVDPEAAAAMGRLESAQGVRRAESEIPPDELRDAHERYAGERDAEIPDSHDGPRPYGGVGGTREGLKCLHAHYAWHLAGGDDPVGRWIEERLSEVAERKRDDD